MIGENAVSADCGIDLHTSTAPCLCVFDIDRTLTGKQDRLHKCPRNREVPGIYDSAYGGGTLILSALGAEGLNKTFCSACYVGVCSAGSGSNDAERTYLATHVLATALQLEFARTVPNAFSWSTGDNINSPLVTNQPDTLKQHAVEEIRQWYSDQGVCIPNRNVHFFGDRTENMAPFREKEGYNAREISCDSRDFGHNHGMIGYCGGTPEEVVAHKGIYKCGDAEAAPWMPPFLR